MDNMHCYGTEDTLSDCRYYLSALTQWRELGFWIKNGYTLYSVSISSITIVLRFEGWGVHDCERTEAAGVQCKEKPPPTTPKPPPTTPRYLRNRK